MFIKVIDIIPKIHVLIYTSYKFRKHNLKYFYQKYMNTITF